MQHPCVCGRQEATMTGGWRGRGGGRGGGGRGGGGGGYVKLQGAEGAVEG